MKNKVFHNFLRVFLFIFSLTVLFFLLRHIGFDKVGESFVKVGIPGAVILIILGLIENGSDAWALSFAIPGKISFINVFSSSCTGSLVNLIIPWEAGEVVKVGLLKRSTGATAAIKGIILWNYILKLSKPCAVITILIISFLAGYDYRTDHFTIVFGAALIGFLPYFGMMILIRSNISVKLAKLLKLLGRKNSDDLLKKAEEMDSSLKKFRKERPRDYRAVLFIQFFARFVSWATFLACAYLAGFDYSFSMLSLAYCAIALSGYIVSFIPAKIGVGEGAGFLIFSFLGLDGGAGLLITFILRIKAIIAMSIASFLNVVR
ncbi:MAG TPA: lysylphosphatidylglycerol synthase domain-containing protein [bacterium]|nr:lysylphosphatidylglycerol synthase domain-containing protein [bacterium]